MTREAKSFSGQFFNGNPSDEEQLFVELINRARADATAEGLRHANSDHPIVAQTLKPINEDGVGVDIDLMVQQFTELPQSRPPLAIDLDLMTAARLHARDMFDHALQDHKSSSNPPAPFKPDFGPGARVGAVGNGFDQVAENIYSYGKDVYHAHAGFQVDWGDKSLDDDGNRNYPTGMQDPPGHRINIHDAKDLGFNRIGVGVIEGTNTVDERTVGPLLVVQNFGRTRAAHPFITGVAYYDFNGNDFYDMGEGIRGVRVDVEETSAFAITSDSGGYTIPIETDGEYTVTFSGELFPTTTEKVRVSNGDNVKVDFTPEPEFSRFTFDTEVYIGYDNVLQFEPFAGATGHKVRVSEVSTEAIVEDLSDGAQNWQFSEAGDLYDILQSGIATGDDDDSAFHLTHVDGNPLGLPLEAFELVIPSATLNRPFKRGENCTLTFSSRLRSTKPSQIARVQLSTDGGDNWFNVHSIPGNDDGFGGESTFSKVEVDLGGPSEEPVLLRFMLDYTSGDLFPGDNKPTVGWYVDDIRIDNLREVLSTKEYDVGAANSFVLNPENGNEYVIEIAGYAEGDELIREYPFGPATTFWPIEGTPEDLEIEVESYGIENGEFMITVVTNRPPATLELLEGDTFTTITNATRISPTELEPGRYRFNFALTGDVKSKFFVVKGQ